METVSLSIELQKARAVTLKLDDEPEETTQVCGSHTFWRIWEALCHDFLSVQFALTQIKIVKILKSVVKTVRVWNHASLKGRVGLVKEMQRGTSMSDGQETVAIGRDNLSYKQEDDCYRSPCTKNSVYFYFFFIISLKTVRFLISGNLEKKNWAALLKPQTAKPLNVMPLQTNKNISSLQLKINKKKKFPK